MLAAPSPSSVLQREHGLPAADNGHFLQCKEMIMHDDENPSPSKRTPWNKRKLIGAKPPLRPKHVWSIRTKLQVAPATWRCSMWRSTASCGAVGCRAMRKAARGFSVLRMAHAAAVAAACAIRSLSSPFDYFRGIFSPPRPPRGAAPPSSPAPRPCAFRAPHDLGAASRLGLSVAALGVSVVARRGVKNPPCRFNAT
jgi:hypothetical protein